MASRKRIGPGAPCFLWDGSRLVLPAYSRDAAGVDVRGGRWRSMRCLAIVGEKVLDFGETGKLPCGR